MEYYFVVLNALCLTHLSSCSEVALDGPLDSCRMGMLLSQRPWAFIPQCCKNQTTLPILVIVCKVLSLVLFATLAKYSQ